MINDKVDKTIKEHFQVLLSMYQIGLETSTKGCNYIIHCVH